MMTSSTAYSSISDGRWRVVPTTRTPWMRRFFFFVVVVDEADRAVADLPRLQHLADDELAGVAGAHDQHLLAIAAEVLAPGRSQIDAGQQPGAAHETEGQQPVEGEHRPAAGDRR